MRGMRGSVRIALAGGLVVVAASVLIAFYAAADRRGKLAHCRNNLRHLGFLAVNNWPLLDPARTGRAFWQEVRAAQYRDVNGKWREIRPDPFVCPFEADGRSAPEDPSTIDYRGPREVPDQARDIPKDRPLGADRPGNHPSGGGWVLRVDASVDKSPSLVDRARPGDPLWQAADKALQD